MMELPPLCIEKVCGHEQFERDLRLNLEFRAGLRAIGVPILVLKVERQLLQQELVKKLQQV